MGSRRSAGLLLFRRTPGSLPEVMIVHMGGPFWAKKNLGAWSIPKGEYEPTEAPLDAARREFAEELGHEAPPGELLDLGELAQAGGKLVRVWALEADLDVSQITSATFQMEWPRGSGRMCEFPEIDRAAWFDMDAARTRLVKGQVGFLDALTQRLGPHG